ncbi:MAG TPA: membrane dipeptidase [Bdellovibrionota bacterium]|nr:membrane dipeptidase [Bdellovibrionota bacterium]
MGVFLPLLGWLIVAFAFTNGLGVRAATVAGNTQKHNPNGPGGGGGLNVQTQVMGFDSFALFTQSANGSITPVSGGNASAGSAAAASIVTNDPFLYITAWGDDVGTQGLLFQIQVNRKMILSGDPLVQVVPSLIDLDQPFPSQGPGSADIRSIAGDADTNLKWRIPTIGGVNNGTFPVESPFPVVPAISSNAHWIWFNSGNDTSHASAPFYPGFNHKEYLIFRVPLSNQAAALSPVPGFADTHIHTFSELAFGGNWLWGNAAGPEDIALAPCDGFSHGRMFLERLTALNPCAHATTILIHVLDFVLSEILGKDTGFHLLRTFGYPTYTGWPRWDVSAHQQVWEGWLKQAHDRGLSLMVMSAVDNAFLCNLNPPTLFNPFCDEMFAVEQEINMAHNFVQNHPWAEIALTPQDARRIIHEGKLAIILAIEASRLFEGAPDYMAELRRFYDLGVRSVQPVHQFDNQFSGAAPHHTVFFIGEFMDTCHIETDCSDRYPFGFDLDSSCKNVKGLTADGVALVNEMMNLGMLIDLSHVSENAVNEIYNISVARNYYPLFMSHGHFREIMTPKKQLEEKTTPANIVDIVKETGGIFGLRTANEEVLHYQPALVPNDCHGSAKSFAQAYALGRNGLNVDIAFATDLNGFITQTRPRYGNTDACETYGKTDPCSGSGIRRESRCQARAECKRSFNGVGTEFDILGLGHEGLLPDLVHQLDNFGIDTTNIENSSEKFIRMWERSIGPRTGPVATAPSDLSGIQAYVSKKDRKRAYRQQKQSCKPNRHTCRTGCRDSFQSCKSDCKTVKGLCVQTCETQKASCSTSCVNTKDTCYANCDQYTGSQRRKCRRECRQDKRECKQTCRQTKRDCKQTCKDTKQACKQQCKDAKASCKAGCKDTFQYCRCNI